MAKNYVSRDVWIARAKRAEARLATVEQAGKIAAKVAANGQAQAGPHWSRGRKGKGTRAGGPAMRAQVDALMAGKLDCIELGGKAAKSVFNQQATANGAFSTWADGVSTLVPGTNKDGSPNKNGLKWAGVTLLLDTQARPMTVKLA